MGRTEVALERRSLEHRGRNQREELPMRSERLLVGGQRGAAVGLDCRGQLVDRGRPPCIARESGYFGSISHITLAIRVTDQLIDSPGPLLGQGEGVTDACI